MLNIRQHIHSYLLRLTSLFALAFFALAFASDPVAACGAAGQRECTILEQIPSCNSGLMAYKGNCEACGAAGERECPATVQIPSCDSGLMAYEGNCEACGASGERECPITVQVPSCDGGLVASKGKCVKGCGGAGEAECPVTVQVPSCDSGLMAFSGKCEACGAEGERPCPLTVQVSSCDSGLVANVVKGLCVPKGSSDIGKDLKEIVGVVDTDFDNFYQNTWEGRALVDQVEFSLDVPLAKATMIGSHNTYNSGAYGYIDPKSEHDDPEPAQRLEPTLSSSTW